MGTMPVWGSMDNLYESALSFRQTGSGYLTQVNSLVVTECLYPRHPTANSRQTSGVLEI